MDTTMLQIPPGLGPAFEACRKAVRYLQENDCDFLTVENVLTYAQLELRYEPAARLALIAEMGLDWYAVGVAYEMRDKGWDYIAGQQLVVTPDARHFAVVRGRRWTRVHEYLSNGQLTARFFVDEATGEARQALSARAPAGHRMHEEAAEFARGIVGRAAACSE